MLIPAQTQPLAEDLPSQALPKVIVLPPVQIDIKPPALDPQSLVEPWPTDPWETTDARSEPVLFSAPGLRIKNTAPLD